MKSKKYKKIVSGILFGVVAFIAGGFKIAYGGDIFSYALDTVIATIVSIIGFIFGVIASVVFWLGGVFVEFAVNINADILSKENAVVQSGWKVVLSFANLGFVLAIIIIAFSTILRRESYAMKQTLWKLIVAALLVNFSLVIAGAFISVSDIVSQMFLDKVTLSGDGNFPLLLGKALGVQTFLDVKSSENGIKGALNKFGKTTMTLITSVLFTAAFTFIGGLTLFALAIMLLIRYVFLSILLIISPIVWLFWIFPATQSYWGKWWNNFFRWTFFQPIVLFFLYLVIVTLEDMGKFFGNIFDKGAGNSSSAANVEVFTFGLDTVGKFITIIGLMIGGLIAANSLSIHFSGTALGWAQTAGKAFGAWSGRKGKALGKNILTSGSKKDVTTGEITTRGQRFAEKISRVPLLRGMASGLSNITSSKARKEEVEKYSKENFSNISNAALLNQANAKTAFLNPVRAAAISQELAKRNLTDKINPALTKRFIKTAEKLGADDPIISNRPDLSDNVTKTMNKIKAGKADEINYRAFENIDVVVNLDNPKLERLGKEGSVAQKDAIRDTIGKDLGAHLTRLEGFENNINRIKEEIKDAQAKGDHNLAKSLILQRNSFTAQRDGLINTLSPNHKKLWKHYDYIRQNVNWQP